MNTAKAAALTEAEAARRAARVDWPKNCPGRGRPHPVSETLSCPWCLPASFFLTNA